ncbi:hypothetical protein [Photobacterium leiognathi]|uniref:hypothetical protein n=1 Tax=Photobacterium leiognathi TaxID=553611 RepID=UPI002981138C|nr:hypothetical protein [Photobacterium leiognathi]
MKNSVICSSVIALAGCTSFHTPLYKEVMLPAENKIEKKDRYIDDIEPEKIITGKIDHDFYIDPNPIPLMATSRKDMPAEFLQNTKLFLADEIPLSTFINFLGDEHDLNVRVEYYAESKSKAKTNNNVNKTVPGDASGPFGSAKPIVDTNGKELFVGPIDFTGSVEKLLDKVSTRLNLSWRYDDYTKSVLFYDLETITYKIAPTGSTIKSNQSVGTSSSSSGEAGQGSTSQSVTISTSIDSMKDMVSVLESFLSSSGTMSYDRLSGILVVRDTLSVHSQLKQYIEELNKASMTEVAMRVDIVKVRRTKNSEYGVSLTDMVDDLNTELILGPALTQPTGGSLLTITGGGNLTSWVKMMQSKGFVTHSSSRYVKTINAETVPVQKFLEDTNVSKISQETDEDGNVKRTPELGDTKTSSTLLFTPRVFNNQVRISTSITISEILKMEFLDEYGVTEKSIGGDSMSSNLVVSDGETEIIAVGVSHKETASSSGPLGADTYFAGGEEVVGTEEEMLVITVTPYILRN